MIRAGDAGYDQRRAVFNAIVDRRPAAIAPCESTEQVQEAVAAAATDGLAITVRGGATSDLATVDGGLVIDLAPMEGVEIDPEAGVARIGGGATWADLDAASQEHGLAVTGARISSMGVAGTALGGGSGWLERPLGPTCRSLVRARLVLADGRAVEASEEENPDLLWALRGAGAGLGVVTEVELALAPVGPTLLAGFLGFARARAAEVARAYRDFVEEAPEQVGGGLILGAGVGGACTIVFSYLGPLEDGERQVAPLRELGPTIDAVAPNPYRSLQVLSDLQNPFGTRTRFRSRFVRELPDAALEAAVAAADRPAATLSHVLLHPLGTARDEDRERMALRLPSSRWAYQCAGLWPPVESLDRGNIAWVDGFVETLGPFALDSTYPGMVAAEEGPERMLACLGADGLARLGGLKEKYDPGDAFRVNLWVSADESSRRSRAG